MFANWENGEEGNFSRRCKTLFFIAKVKVAVTTADTRSKILSHTKTARSN